MEAFKFLRRHDVPFWTEEKTVKLATLEAFAQGRSQGGYNDPMEPRIHLGAGIVGSVEFPSERQIIANARMVGIDVRAGSNISFANNTARRPNRFAFCLSHALTREICYRWFQAEQYDVVLRIPDVERFALAIMDADGIGERRLGTECTIQSVQYAVMPLDPRRVDLISYPCYKDIYQFGWQDELRLNWLRPQPSTARAYLLRIPDLHELFEVVEIPDHWLE